jgi:hypothetical protein
MVEMNKFLKKKTAYIILGIGTICLLLGPIFGVALDKMTIYDSKPEIIQEDSADGMTKAFAYPVTLNRDQKLIIEISDFYQNSYVTIRILANSVYQRAYSLNSTTSGVSGLQFVYSEFGYGATPAGSTVGTNTLTLPANGIFFYIEFMGDRTGDSLISWPGDYYVVVYGSNSGPASEINVLFDIQIKVDGPGEALYNFFILIGVLIILIYLMVALTSVLKANYLR